MRARVRVVEECVAFEITPFMVIDESRGGDDGRGSSIDAVRASRAA